MKNEIKFCPVFNFHTFETKVTLDQKKIHFSFDEKEFRCTFVLKSTYFLFIKGAYVYWYFQFFPSLRLFHSLRLLNFNKFPMPTFIKEPTFIRYLRVCTYLSVFNETFLHNFLRTRFWNEL